MRCSKRLLVKRQFPLSTPAPTGFGSCLASQRQLTSLNQWKINQCRKLHFLKTEEFRYETKLVEKKKKERKKIGLHCQKKAQGELKSTFQLW